MNAPVSAPVSQAKLDIRSLAFRRLDIEGNELPSTTTDGHVITHFPALGLMFDMRKPKTVTSAKGANKYAAQVDLLGRKGDWVIGEDVETALLIDRRFREPAVNPLVAPNMPSSGLIYTNTPLKGSSGRVWFVGLGYGSVGRGLDDSGGLAVPVLRVPPSQ